MPEESGRRGEPFFSTTQFAGGTELGLVTAYDIVARHNGRIDVHSRKGEGTTVTIRLPSVASAGIAQE